MRKATDEQKMQGEVSRRSIFFGAGALLLAPAARASAEEPPTARISSFYTVLLEVMKNAKALGFSGRYAKLAPEIEATFDLPTMTRFAVGPEWANLSQAEQKGLLAAFRRMTVANYAHNFDGYDGQQFTVDPKFQTRGPDSVVSTELTSPTDSPVKLAYRMRKSGGVWKVIDVYYNNSISELTTRRAEFSGVLRTQGAASLQAHINKLADDLSK